MKIAPYTEKWNEGERDWSFVADPKTSIEQWERSTGNLLPSEYRSFLLRFNGGRVYPRLFNHTIGPMPAGPYIDNTPVTFVDLIMDWASVEKHWNHEVYGDGIPPGYLVFASTPGAIQLLISLNPENYGEVVTWIHSTSIWGTDSNTKIYKQAKNFSEFLFSLYDDQDKSDYEDWQVPIYDKIAKELDIATLT